MAKKTKDEETGIDAVSEDGAGATDDELAARRKKGGSAATRGEQQQTDDAGDPPEQGEEDDGQMFVWEQGRKVTLGTLINRGTPVEYRFAFGAKSSKGSGNLIPLDEDVLLVSRGKVSSYSIAPTRDDEEKVTSVAITVNIAPKVIRPADSDEAMGMLAGVFEKRNIKGAA